MATNYLYLVTDSEGITFTWFCPECKAFAKDPRIWVNESPESSNYSLKEYGEHPACNHFVDGASITCRIANSQSPCTECYTYEEFKQLYSNIDEHYSRSEGDQFIKTGLVTVNQWMPEPQNPDTQYIKTWFDGDCRECGKHHHSWSYLEVE